MAMKRCPSHHLNDTRIQINTNDEIGICHTPSRLLEEIGHAQYARIAGALLDRQIEAAVGWTARYGRSRERRWIAQEHSQLDEIGFIQRNKAAEAAWPRHAFRYDVALCKHRFEYSTAGLRRFAKDQRHNPLSSRPIHRMYPQPSIRVVRCSAFADQQMGTAGLRKKVQVFQQPHYLETFAQAVFDVLQLAPGATLVVGGDGRYHNDVAIQVILRMAIAAGVGHIIVGQRGLLSTPAASCLIRARRAAGGFLLTASHNPGGPNGDFGIKFNVASGGQAPLHLTDAVYAASTALDGYRIADSGPFDLSSIGIEYLDGIKIEVVDPVAEYARQMEQLFDFDRIGEWLRSGHRILFDAMHGATGPYAQRILGDSLGARHEDLLHINPLPDFGGLHPDPNPVDCEHLVQCCAGTDAPDMAAASDGDGDRNMILGPGFLLSPGDSVAMMLANAPLVPGYRSGIPGVARSMPTSRALDDVAERLGIPCYETPTGWRYFCNLLESGRIGLCGEESFGTGSAHSREKDGLWTVLFWLNVLAARGESLHRISTRHWSEFGRRYFQRHDFDISDTAKANAVMDGLRLRVAAMTGTTLDGAQVELADDFRYRDPVDASESSRQGIRIVLNDGRRMVFRLSGTGTTGATLRVYLEQLEQARARQALDTDTLIAPLGQLAMQIAEISSLTGLAAPSARI